MVRVVVVSLTLRGGRAGSREFLTAEDLLDLEALESLLVLALLRFELLGQLSLVALLILECESVGGLSLSGQSDDQTESARGQKRNSANAPCSAGCG